MGSVILILATGDITKKKDKVLALMELVFPGVLLGKLYLSSYCIPGAELHGNGGRYKDIRDIIYLFKKPVT